MEQQNVGGRFPLTDAEIARLRAITRDKEALEMAATKLVDEIQKMGARVKEEELTFWDELLRTRGLDVGASASVDLNSQELVIEDPDIEDLKNWKPTTKQ